MNARVDSRPARSAPPASRCRLRASFALAFTNWRERKNVPLKQIATDLDLSFGTVSMWGTGKRFPSEHHLERLADYMGVPPCRLFCFIGDRCVPPECLQPLPGRARSAPLHRVSL